MYFKVRWRHIIEFEVYLGCWRAGQWLGLETRSNCSALYFSRSGVLVVLQCQMRNQLL